LAQALQLSSCTCVGVGACFLEKTLGLAMADKEKEPAEVKESESEEDDDDDDELDDEEMERQMELQQKKGARCSVTAESRKVDADWKPPVHAKTDEQTEVLKKAVGKSFVFSAIKDDPTLFNQIIGAFSGPHKYKAGDEVISQGKIVTSDEPGLFIIESGKLDVYKKKDEHPAPGIKVFAYDTMGQFFGELALLYNAPRAATVVASDDCVLWSIDRDTFNNCVVGGYQALREKNATFLKSVEIFNCLKKEDIQRLLDVVKTRAFEKGQKIITKGENGEELFLLHEGTAAASVDGKTVKEYDQAGSYFGELALLEKTTRKADVLATSTPTVVAVIDSEAFTSLLGDIHELMKNNAKDYDPLPKDAPPPKDGGGYDKKEEPPMF